MSRHLAPLSGNPVGASYPIGGGRHRSTDVDDWERQLMEGLAPELSAELAAGILAPPVSAMREAKATSTVKHTAQCVRLNLANLLCWDRGDGNGECIGRHREVRNEPLTGRGFELGAL